MNEAIEDELTKFPYNLSILHQNSYSYNINE
jgi:hypothetical protein